MFCDGLVYMSTNWYKTTTFLRMRKEIKFHFSDLFIRNVIILFVWQSCGSIQQEISQFSESDLKYDSKYYNKSCLTTPDSVSLSYAYHMKSLSRFETYIEVILQWESCIYQRFDKLILTFLKTFRGFKWTLDNQFFQWMPTLYAYKLLLFCIYYQI